MRILIVASSLFVGGQERQMLELARGLIARGHTVHISVPYAGDPQQPVFEASGVEVIPELPNRARSWKPLARATRVPRRVSALRRTIRTGRYDVVHGYGVASNIYATAASLRLPARSVWGIRDSIPLTLKPHLLLERALLPFASLVIANSPAGRQVCLDRGFPTDKTIVIENGMDASRFRINPGWREETRRALGVGVDETLIGTIGRVQPVKNIEGFLRAGAIVASHRSGMRFLVMGPGDPAYVRELRDLAAELEIGDRVVWLEPQIDVERYDNALDVFVSATKHREGMMNAAIEAMACGTPCVVTDMGSVAEIVGDHGRIVTDHRPEAIARAIEEILDNPDGWTRKDIRAAVVQRFDTARLAERTEQALAGLAKAPDRRNVGN